MAHRLIGSPPIVTLQRVPTKKKNEAVVLHNLFSGALLSRTSRVRDDVDECQEKETPG